ncbi:MAG: acetolactate synthase large subunit, partial [Candidatus Zixiibacteriota bacterium]
VKYDRNLYTVGLQTRDHVTCTIEEADLIVTVGYDIVEYSPCFWNPDGKKRIIHIDFEPAEVDYWYDPEVEVVGDIAGSLWELNQHIDDSFDSSRGSFALKYRDEILKDIHRYDHDNSFPLKPQKMLYEIRQVMGDEDILVSDVGAHKVWIARMYLVHAPNTCLISNGLASMGIAVPGGIAAKIVNPARRVMTVSGDGGFLMNVQELETAVRLGTPTVNLIWSDGTFGLIEWKQQTLYGHVFGTQFTNPDHLKLAESFGAVGMRVNKGDNLREILSKAFECNRPVVIDCPVDYSENLKLTERLGELVCPV